MKDILSHLLSKIRCLCILLNIVESHSKTHKSWNVCQIKGYGNKTITVLHWFSLMARFTVKFPLRHHEVGKGCSLQLLTEHTYSVGIVSVSKLIHFGKSRMKNYRVKHNLFINFTENYTWYYCNFSPWLPDFN